MNMTRQILRYIRENALSVEAIVAATGVDRKMFSRQRPRSFNATEMLEVCNYLRMDPYRFWGERGHEEQLSENRAEK